MTTANRITNRLSYAQTNNMYIYLSPSLYICRLLALFALFLVLVRTPNYISASIRSLVNHVVLKRHLMRIHTLQPIASAEGVNFTLYRRRPQTNQLVGSSRGQSCWGQSWGPTGWGQQAGGNMVAERLGMLGATGWGQHGS